ncbi:MAG: DNA cytosine methyltransferase [Cyanobacteria bacterium J06656_5]
MSSSVLTDCQSICQVCLQVKDRPEQHRAITLRETAMLQTFPRSYKFLPKDEKVIFYILGRLIGNAVPVKLAKSIGCEFIKHVKAHST